MTASRKPKTKPKARKAAPKKAAAKATQKARKLDDREKRFVLEYPIDLDACRAALVAGYSESMAKSKAYQWVSDSKTKPHVYAAVQKALAARAERTGITQDKVLAELWGIATADANALVEYRRVPCRYCYGAGHKYQHTAAEQAERERKHAADEAVRERLDGYKAEAFDPQGGIGYDERKEPHVDCPECFGEGTGKPFVKDTRNLPAEVRALYAGVRVTRDGIDVKTHSKDRALELIGKHVGLFKDKLELSGPNGGAIPIKAVKDELAEAFNDAAGDGA